MYGFDSMIDIGMPKRSKWKSEAHREVAITVCICNPHVHDSTTLASNVRIINKIPKNKIEKVTWDQIRGMGCIL